MYNYIVWVGGTEIGQYATEDEADQVYDDWIEEGYQDVQIEEIEVEVDPETPEETNAWLRAGGY